MSDKYSFRSSMNGFNRSEVISYIEKLMAERQLLSARTSALETQNSELKSENEALKAELDALRTELEAEKAKKAEIKEASTKCEDCNISKVYEARLGAAMLDAKRFSEVLVKEANDKVSGVYSKALADADATSKNADEIAQTIVKLNNQLNNSLAQLLTNMKDITSSINTFKSDVITKEKGYKFSTDFAEIPTDVKETVIVKQTYSFKNSPINFDDADEYEIRVDV